MLAVKNLKCLAHNNYSIKVYCCCYERVPRNHLIKIPHFANEETMAQGGSNTAC